MMRLSERGTVWQHRKARFVRVTSEVAKLESQNAALLEALKDARGAIDSLDEHDLGVATGSDGYQWPIKAELLSKIDEAIAKGE